MKLIRHIAAFSANSAPHRLTG